MWLYRAIFGQRNPLPDHSILFNTGTQQDKTGLDWYDDEEIPDEECTKDTGYVTMITDHYGLIDGIYFEHDRMTLFAEGMLVDYYWYTRNGLKKINRVIEPVESESDEEENFHKKVITQVVKRDGRKVIANRDISFNLNEVIYTFIPAAGDWIEVECVVELDENKKDLAGEVLNIVKINPVRSMTIVGEIREYNSTTRIGMIDDNVMFNKNSSCTPGYIPRVGDLVSADIIESTQGSCNWRALSVTPETNQRPHDVPRNHLNTDDDIHYGDTGNVVVSRVNKIRFKDIGEETQFEIRVHNHNTEPHEIVHVEIQSTESQLSLITPQFPGNIALEKHDIVTLKFRCQAKFMGSTRELVVLYFSNCKIGRWVHITVGNATMHDAQCVRNPKINNQTLAAAARKSFMLGEQHIVAGERLIRPPAFIVNKLPNYDIPERFAKKMFRELESNSEHMEIMTMERIAPYLLQKLTARNYKETFHTLLYIEELTIQIQMRRYDIKLAKFDVCGSLFRLEVPDLLERRPSVVIGDKVIATNPNDPDPEDKKHRFEGLVHRTSAKHIFLGFNPQFHAAYGGEDFAIEFHPSRMNFRRYHHGINVAMKVLGPDFLFPTSVPKRDPQVKFVVETKRLRDLKRIEDRQIQLEKEGKETTKIVRMCDRKVKPLFWFDRTLNHYQQLAIQNIIRGEARPLPYLLFGPPGTGKTVTLIETILQVHTLMRHSRILVIGPSNAAADLIALRLLDSTVLQPGDLVRMVAYRCVVDKTIPERLIPYAITGDIAREGSRESKERMENGVRMNVLASEVGRHRIIIATCAVVGNLYTMGFPPGHFTHIIIDEAGQIAEPETMIPLSLLDVHSAQTILAGDPLQLGPCIFSILARDYGLGESYFERMIKTNIYKRDPSGFPETGGYDPRLVTRLVYNYRSLPEILALSNDLFYDSELQPMISDKEGTEVDLLRQVRHILPERRRELDSSEEEVDNSELLPPAVVFHGVRGQNLQTSDSPSWFNPSEAGQVVNYLKQFYAAGLTSKDIGIITPYTKQCAHLRELISGLDLNLPKIGSVEEFQGQEFKVVIMSTVRSNESAAHSDGRYGLGFIASPHRLNVAVSRARALLIIIGNPHLLITDYYWRSVIMYAVNLGGYRGCNLPQELNLGSNAVNNVPRH